MHWLIVPQPESGADSLAMHLAIPMNIATHHVFTYRPGRIFWSVMPMGADWCYTMVYMLGGEYAGRLLNFTMLLLVEALLYCAVRRSVTPTLAFVVLALFASTSMVQLVTGSMYVENFLAAMVFGTLAAAWRFGETGERRFLYAASILGGTALAIKLGGLAYLAAIIPVAAMEVRRQRQRLGARPALAGRYRGGPAAGGRAAHLRDRLADDRESDIPVSQPEVYRLWWTMRRCSRTPGSSRP